jgi:DNA-binding beta-propeller fold protein YncE
VVRVQLRPETALLCLCLLLASFLVWGVTPAAGARGHVFEKEFGGPCAAEPCEGKLKEPDGVAVNEATGDVYVVDKGANRVTRYSAAGVYELEFNGSGTPQKAFSSPEAIAVDNSCSLRKVAEPTCKTEDPSNEDVYVVDGNHHVVDKFTGAGTYVGQITAAENGESFGEVYGVSVDRSGTVWLYQRANGVGPVIDGFTDESVSTFTKQIPSGARLFSGRGERAFATEVNGGFYAGQSGGSAAQLGKVDAEGHILVEEIGEGSEAFTSVAVDQGTNDLYSSDGAEVVRRNSATTVLERIGSGHLRAAAGIGLNAATGQVYVADAASDFVTVFALEPVSVPRVAGESISNVTGDSAELSAEVDPTTEGGEQGTRYRFEYGPCATLSQCGSSGYPARLPVGEGSLPASFELFSIGVRLEGLSAGTTYHFRLNASNGHGPHQGGERTFTTQTAGGELVLPDNRAWELVTPPDKFGALIEPIREYGVIEAAAGGGAMTYLANAPTEAEPQGYSNEVQVLSTRTATGWSSRDVAIPHDGATGKAVGPEVEYKLFAEDLSSAVVQPFGEFIPQLSAEASEQTAYLHNLSGSCGSACYQPLVTAAAGHENALAGFGNERECGPEHLGAEASVSCGPEFAGATPDLSHVVLVSKLPLRPGAGEAQLYEWAAGQLTQISLLPNGGGPASAPRLGAHEKAAPNAISSDGSRVVWEAEHTLYMRDVAEGKTIELDRAEAGCEEPACESGGGHFQVADRLGMHVYFTDQRPLTKDAGATGGDPDLYECDVIEIAGVPECRMTDLTPKQNGESGDVQGRVLGASSDGSRVYFVADGIQTAAPNGNGDKALSGRPNLYERDGETTRFIVTLSLKDSHDWSARNAPGEEESLQEQPTRVSPNGRWLAFMSQGSLTGYDNRDVATARPVAEVYLYDASGGGLVCVSCDPTNARPVGVEYAKLQNSNGGLVGSVNLWESNELVAANVPAWTAIGVGAQEKERYQSRYLSDSGRMYFDSVNSLVSQDVNGTQDVYEFEPGGYANSVGRVECTEESVGFDQRANGCVDLISSGRSGQESAFMDASESGEDVYFLTAAKLVHQDLDGAFDVYDAHECENAAPCISSTVSGPAPCTAEASEASCRPSASSQPEIFGPPPSATVIGPGNVAPVPAPLRPKPRTAAQIRAEKLAKALRSCKKVKRKSSRMACERQARKKYGPPKTKKTRGRTG